MSKFCGLAQNHEFRIKLWSLVMNICYRLKYVWVGVLCQQQALLGNCDTLFMTLPHEQIREFHKQWYLLTDCALEIFLSTGKTCLLAFNLTTVSQTFYVKLTVYIVYCDDIYVTLYKYKICVRLCRVAGDPICDPIWQMTLCSCEMDSH